MDSDEEMGVNELVYDNVLTSLSAILKMSSVSFVDNAAQVNVVEAFDLPNLSVFSQPNLQLVFQVLCYYFPFIFKAVEQKTTPVLVPLIVNNRRLNAWFDVLETNNMFIESALIAPVASAKPVWILKSTQRYNDIYQSLFNILYCLHEFFTVKAAVQQFFEKKTSLDVDSQTNALFTYLETLKNVMATPFPNSLYTNLSFLQVISKLFHEALGVLENKASARRIEDFTAFLKYVLVTQNMLNTDIELFITVCSDYLEKPQLCFEFCGTRVMVPSSSNAGAAAVGPAAAVDADSDVGSSDSERSEDEEESSENEEFFAAEDEPEEQKELEGGVKTGTESKSDSSSQAPASGVTSTPQKRGLRQYLMSLIGLGGPSEPVVKRQYFGCKVIQRKCKKEGCHKWVDIGAPYCAEHLKSELSLEIKDSTVPNGGLGVFATAKIKHKKVICDYGGETIDEDEMSQRYGPGDDFEGIYVMQIEYLNKFHDAACLRSVGAIINHGDNPNVKSFSHTYRTANGKKAQKIQIKAKRDIQPGEELFLWYGDEYFSSDSDPNIKTKHRTISCAQKESTKDHPDSLSQMCGFK
jgi:hypothetical protein